MNVQQQQPIRTMTPGQRNRSLAAISPDSCAAGSSQLARAANPRGPRPWSRCAKAKEEHDEQRKPERQVPDHRVRPRAPGSVRPPRSGSRSRVRRGNGQHRADEQDESDQPSPSPAVRPPAILWRRPGSRRPQRPEDGQTQLALNLPGLEDPAAEQVLDDGDADGEEKAGEEAGQRGSASDSATLARAESAPA